MLIDGEETLTEAIQSKVVSRQGCRPPRPLRPLFSVVGLGAGGATVYLVVGCPDKGADPVKVAAKAENTDCAQTNDISLGNAESSGGKISVDIETSSSDFRAWR